MKKNAIIILAALFGSIASFGQSESYTLLKEKFRGHENVFSISTSGFVTRTVLTMAGEHEFNRVIKEVKHIHLTTIPTRAFRKEEVTVAGFIRKAKEDAFDELAKVDNAGDHITLLLQRQPKKRNKTNHYLLIVEERNEVVVMEIAGYIDPKLLLDCYKKENNSHYRKI